MSDRHEHNPQEELAEIDRSRLRNMEADIRDIRQNQQFIVAALPNKDEYVETILRERKGSVDVCIALEKEPHTQHELESLLHLHQSNISRICVHLLDANFIQVSNLHETPQKYMISLLGKRIKVVRIARQISNE